LFAAGIRQRQGKLHFFLLDLPLSIEAEANCFDNGSTSLLDPEEEEPKSTCACINHFAPLCQ
tara:strand:+ start:423 stop:608 length:186 start_codon:yes stop_codon:yes gene_type:complete